jgi:hypothetical protein
MLCGWRKDWRRTSFNYCSSEWGWWMTIERVAAQPGRLVAIMIIIWAGAGLRKGIIIFIDVVAIVDKASA